MSLGDSTADGRRWLQGFDMCGVDLLAQSGRVHGLLGPNGAGKTTLMRVLLVLVQQDAGSVHLIGHHLDSTAGPVPDGVAGRRWWRRFSAEDRYGTWKMILTRSGSRADVFAGKVIVALAFSCFAVIMLAISSVVAGVLVIGSTPLINLSGMLIQPADALRQVALAWMSVLPPALAFTAFAVLLSVLTRSSVVGVGLPVVVGLVMQLAALVDGPELIRRLMITSAFGAWHGLLAEPPYYRPIVHGALVSAAYFIRVNGPAS